MGAAMSTTPPIFEVVFTPAHDVECPDHAAEVMAAGQWREAKRAADERELAAHIRADAKFGLCQVRTRDGRVAYSYRAGRSAHAVTA